MKILRTAITLSIALIIVTTATAQMKRVVRRTKGSSVPAQTAAITDEQKTEVIESLIDAIEESYLFPERSEEIAAHLRELLGTEKYRAVEDTHRFAREVTDDLRAFTNDLHFSLLYDPERSESMARMMEEPPGPGAARVGFGAGVQAPDPNSELYKAIVEPFARNNFNFRKLEVLDGNIGYLKLDMMPPLEPAKPTLDAAMAFLAGTDAMIIDLRGTPGGVGGFIPYFMSYFFAEEGKLLYTRRFGAEGTTEEYRTHAEIGGKRRPDVPLYILTSGLTGSAAENLSYTLKHHHRATIIGETTVGGGHSARGSALAEGFIANIPFAQVIHPETGRGFDRVGVKPDIDVPAGEALHVAHRKILQDLIAASDDPGREAELEAALTTIEEEHRLAGATKASANVDLSAYPGRYGIRTVLLEDGRLKYQREGGPRVPLKQVGEDLFRLDLPAGVRARGPIPDIRFERGDNNLVRGISLVREDGTVEEFLEKNG